MTGDTQQKYLDLTAKTGEEFGQKTAVFLPDASARGFSVEVTQAVFADNSTWEGTAAPWEPLLPAESLSGKLGDAELLKQYRIKFGGKCEAVPQVNRDLWRCACGAWNKGEICYACKNDKGTLFSLDLDELKAERDARLAKEKVEREAKEAADKAAAEAKEKKKKTILVIVVPILVLCLAALVYFKGLLPEIRYGQAMEFLEAQQYQEAAATFEKLNGYKDSEAQREAAEKRVEFENANVILAGQSLILGEQNDPSDSWKDEWSFYPDGRFHHIYNSARYGSEYESADATYQLVAVIRPDMLLVELQIGKSISTSKYPSGEVSTFERSNITDYVVVFLDEENRIEDIQHAQLVDLEPTDERPEYEHEEAYYFFRNSKGEIWKIIEPFDWKGFYDLS